ncbi:MAG: type IV toxin-antitoxin system AbiEi family antitoxin domain-containing protein [Nocardioides sp.]|nr:type IV toxin-antitoxin system AbiEi family antitoxin domain-containing protein [Nocardioides sp.]
MNEILAPLDGSVWLRSELIDAGHSDRDLARLVRAGVLRRVRRGAYVDGTTYDAADADSRHRLLARAVAKQAKTRVIISHVSAVPFHEGPTWGMSLDLGHVTRPDGRAGRSEAGVRQHQGVVLEGDVVVRQGLEVMSATRTALDVTTCASAEASLVLVNDFLHRRLTTLHDLQSRYASMKNDPHTLKTDLVLRLADSRSESVGESRTFFMCYRGGVPAPIPQYELRDDHGDLIARLDFAWPKLRVWLEFDGREKYLKHVRDGESVVDAVIREKQRESMIAELTGWTCIRITWADLQRPDATVARILAVLGVAPRVPSATR